METNQQRWRGSIQLLLGLSLTILFFYMMAPFMIAILLGAITAAICHPIYDRLLLRLPRAIAGAVVTVLVALGFVGPLFTILYVGAFRLKEWLGALKVWKEGQDLEGLLHHPAVNKMVALFSKALPFDRSWVQGQAFSVLGDLLEKLSGILAGALKEMPGLLLAFGVVLLSLYFFLTDGGKFLRFLARLSPLKAERSEELYGAFESSCRGVVLGLLLSALVQAVLMTVLWAAVGFSDALLVGVLTLIAGMVPIVGTAPIWIGATITLGLQGKIFAMVIMLVGGIVISTSDNFVKIWVMKGQSEMHPLLALVSVFGALNLVGPMGIFLGPIIAAVFVSFLKIVSQEMDREVK